MQKQHMETNEVQANGGEILNKRHNREGQASAAYHVSSRQWPKVVFVFTALALMNSGCGSSKPQKQNRDFFYIGKPRSGPARQPANG